MNKAQICDDRPVAPVFRQEGPIATVTLAGTLDLRFESAYMDTVKTVAEEWWADKHIRRIVLDLRQVHLFGAAGMRIVRAFAINGQRKRTIVTILPAQQPQRDNFYYQLNAFELVEIEF